MSVLKGPLTAIIKDEVCTLKDYLESRMLCSIDLLKDSNESFVEFIRTTILIVDPLIPKKLSQGFEKLKNMFGKYKLNLDDFVNLKVNMKNGLLINMDKILELSSLLALHYYNKSKNHYLCCGKRVNVADLQEIKCSQYNADKNWFHDKDTINITIQEFELILCYYFPLMKKSLSIKVVNGSMDIELLKPLEVDSCLTALFRIQGIDNWEKLLIKIGPIEMIYLLVCCIIFKKIDRETDSFIQQSGRMLTNDYLDELSKNRIKINSYKIQENNFGKLIKNEKKESGIGKLFKIDIPIHSNVLYCDHFSRKGGLPCLSLLRLLPPNQLGARTLLRFVLHSDELFKDHDKQSLLNALGSYNMNKYSRVRCKLAYKFLNVFEKLLINTRKVSPIPVLSKICPIKTIEKENLENLNKLPIFWFETNTTKIVEFLRIILVNILPKDILGTYKNFKTFINKKIPIIINLHVRESFKIRHTMNGMEISKWINYIINDNYYKFIESKSSIPLTTSGFKNVFKNKKSLICLGKNYIARNIYFIITYLINPILRCHFYVTDTEGSNKIRYYRHPVWIKIVRQADKKYLDYILRDVHFKDMKNGQLEKSEYNDQVLENIENVPKIRWIPKAKGLRPLLNLSKVGSGVILLKKLEENHQCKQKIKNNYCDCNLIWTGGDLPTSWTRDKNNVINNSNNSKTRPSSSKTVDIRRPSTNNMLFYPSKILRSYLIRNIGQRFIKFSGRSYLGTSVVRYGDVYKFIKNWWSYNKKKVVMQRLIEYMKCLKLNGREKTIEEMSKKSLNKVYIIKADMVNCYENIDKGRIMEFLDHIYIPDEILMLTLYNRTLNKSTLIPPFDNMLKDYYFDEYDRKSIIISKGKLKTIPIFDHNKDFNKKMRLEELIGSEYLNNKIINELKELSNYRPALSIMGYRRADLFTDLNSRRIINWSEAKKLLKLHLNNNYIRLRTVDKATRNKKANESAKVKKKYCYNIVRQNNGIPQGSVISYILCCLYYGLMDYDLQIQNLLTNYNKDMEQNKKGLQNLAWDTISNQHDNDQEYCEKIPIKKERICDNCYDHTRIYELNINDEFHPNKRRKIDNKLGKTLNNPDFYIDIQNHDNFKSSKSKYDDVEYTRVKQENYMNDRNLLIRWVDDFLFFTMDIESAKKFLDFLYIKKLWGSNITRDKINSNFIWYDVDDQIVILDEDEIDENEDIHMDINEKSIKKNEYKTNNQFKNQYSFQNKQSKESDSKKTESFDENQIQKKEFQDKGEHNILNNSIDLCMKFPIKTYINVDKNKNSIVKQAQDERRNEIKQKKIFAIKQFQEQVSWSGMKFSSNSFYISCRIIPWKNVNFTSIMDTITLTVNDKYSYKSISQRYKPIFVQEHFNKSNYMWSVLGIKLLSYFDLRIKNGLFYDCKINSIQTVSFK